MTAPRFSYWTKGLFAAAVTFLAQLNVLLFADQTVSDFTQGQWVGIISATLIVFGGVVGLQETPADVASSVRDGG